MAIKNEGKRFRILIISAAYPPNPGGVATHVANLAHGLLQHGRFDVYVLCSTEGTQRTTPTLQPNRRLVVWKRPISQVPNFSGRRAPYGDLLDFVLAQWWDDKPDLIHAHDLDSVQLGCTLKGAFGTPLIVTVHRAPHPWRDESHAEGSKACYLEAMKFYRFADAVVVPSQASCDVLTEQGFAKTHLHIIPHGVETKHLASFCNQPSMLRELGVGSDCRLILCPTRIDPNKDPWTFVRAASILKKEIGFGRLLFLLTCEETSAESAGLRAAADKLGLSKSDMLFRSFERSAMPTLYRHAAVCVVPSRRESFGQVVLEAFVYRAPVVAANAASLKEIVQNQVNGLLFSDGDEDDLAQQVRRVLKSRALAQTLTDGGLKSVTQQYSAKKMIAKYAELYERVLKRSRA